MKKAAILLDSSSAYNGKGVEDVYMIPLKIILNEATVKEFKEFEDIDRAQIYKWVSQGKKLSTSQPSMGEAMLMFEELLTKYETIYVLPISKGISGTYETMTSVAKEVDANRIVVLDTNFLAHELLFLGQNILKMVNAGKTKEDVTQFMNDFHKRNLACIIVNDINHLKRGGRIGTLKSWVANLLKLKIIVEFNGKLELIDKKTSLKDAVFRCLDQINSKLDLAKNKMAKIELWNNNTEASNSVEETKGYIQEWFKIKKISLEGIPFPTDLDFPGVITIHTGTNTIGIVVILK